MAKNFTKGGQIVDMEANYPFDITAHDDNNINVVGAKVHCNQTGNYNLELEGSTTPKIFYLVAGVTYPFRVRKVKLTNTDNANGLIGITSVHSDETE
jgi:hypothetical protein